MDRVKTSGIWARVTTSWASAGGGELLRGVGNAVSGTGAGASLEGVEETHPVADFVGDGLSEVVVCGCSTWGGAVEYGATIILFSTGQFLAFYKCFRRRSLKAGMLT